MNKYNSNIHHRRSIRLKGYDYSQAGLYFITICTENHKYLFGKIIDGKMILNDAGEIVKNEWEKSEKIRNEIKLHEYVVMPNHFHGIVEIISNGRGERPFARTSPFARTPSNGNMAINKNMPKMQSKSIGSLMAGYKSSVTVKINTINNTAYNKLWQRNYWEHIIRNENEYLRISQYIINNPQKWQTDKLNGGSGNIVMESPSPYREESWMV